MSREHGICSRTVMDDSDPDITFDEDGICQYYHHARHRLETECFHDAEGERRLHQIAENIRREGRGKAYDCILGLSGGADSTYVAVRAHELGLRPLAVHLDNGWNTEIAVANIEKTLRHFDMDLYTHVIDWEVFKDIQRSLFFASVANVEVATDHAIFALLYQVAAKFDVRWILSGSNVETESIMPASWGYDARDLRSLRSIHRRHGALAHERSFPSMGPLSFLWHVFVKRIRFLPVLNYGHYDKERAVARMAETFNWSPYERKHGESRFTRFFQEYYLPEKFSIDKRKAHLSSLIAAGKLDRDSALAALNAPLYRPTEREIDVEYVTRKLGFSASDWQQIMQTPPRSYRDYDHNDWMFDHESPLVKRIRAFAKGEGQVTKISAGP